MTTLTYSVQVVGGAVGVLADQDGSQLDAQANVTITASDEYYLKVEHISGRGIRGQYLLDLDVHDTVPPQITSISVLAAEGGTVGLLLNPFTVSFSEDLQTAGVTALSTWDLREAGEDGEFDTGDDVVYTLSVSGGSRSANLTVTNGPLQPGSYCFRAVASGLLDLFDNLLDGDGDGVGGDDFLRHFSVVAPAGYVMENRSNNSLVSATPLPLYEDPVGSGFLTSAIAWGAIDPSGDSDDWSFEAQAGDRLIIDMEVSSGNLYPRFIVYNAAGQSLVDTSNRGSGFGSPRKTTESAYLIPATGTYYLRALSNSSYYPTGIYHFRFDLGRDVQLEPYDYSCANNTLAGASSYPLTVSADQRYGTIAGSLYSQEGVDYHRIGTVNAGETIFVNTRLPSFSTLSPAVEVWDDRGFYWNERVGGRPFDGVAEVEVTETRTFYVAIRPNSGQGIRGQYLLDVQVVPTGLLDFPDLIATEMTAPVEALSGDEIEVSWTVANVGHAATLVGQWNDRIYLSSDDVLGSAGDLFLGSFPHQGVLDVGESYQQVATVRLPDGISGTYWIYVKVDADNAVNEHLLEGNNITASPTPLEITLAPYADLQVAAVSISELVVGNPATIDVSWTVTLTKARAKGEPPPGSIASCSPTTRSTGMPMTRISASSPTPARWLSIRRTGAPRRSCCLRACQGNTTCLW